MQPPFPVPALGRLAGAALLCALAPLAVAGDRIMIDAEQQRMLGVTLVAPVPVLEVPGARHPGMVVVPNERLRVVSAPQAGLVESLLVAEGDRITIGQPLARLQSPSLIAVQRELLDARNLEALAREELNRIRLGVKEGIGARLELDRAQSAHAARVTALTQARELLALSGMDGEAVTALEQAGHMTTVITLTAPLTGVVLDQLVTAGERVEAATAVYRVADLSALWLDIHVPVREADRVSLADTASVPATGASGRVITIGRKVHEADQGVLIRAEVTENPDRLRPGQFVEAQIDCHCEVGTVFRLPRAAVVRNQGKAVVFVHIDGGFQVQPVEIYGETGDVIMVQAPFAEGAAVAVSATAALKAAWLGIGE
ncbi:MAG: efflux RND transporter periplasmic adaptor subunit [Gammaproteobacteria bacterium]|nr:efflux RND transporter periplasmic adaptor subunit [Gammaproteobacteria bacterium]